LELQQIKYFLAVVDFGTFLAASEQVHVTQPTLSAGIRKLEESLNVKLFERGSRAATLTPSGELFLTHARNAYEKLMLVKSKLLANAERINIGVLNTIPIEHIAQIIRVYKLNKPHVFIELFVGGIDELKSKLQSKKLDLIFTSKHPNLSHFTVLFEEQLELAVSGQHSFASLKEISVEDLVQQPFIERIGCESWDEVHHFFEQHQMTPNNVCRAEKDESVLSLVAANLGVSIMPIRETPYDVKFVKIKGLNIIRPIGMSFLSSVRPEYLKDFYGTVMSLYKKVSKDD